MCSLNGWLHICAEDPTARWFRCICGGCVGGGDGWGCGGGGGGGEGELAGWRGAEKFQKLVNDSE